jgi:hypothetical protein
MSPETLIWIAGAIVVPGLTWTIAVLWLLRDIKRGTDALVVMHEHPEATGFGTVGMDRVISENARATRELSHYIMWATKAQTGSEPPPLLSRNTE